MDEKMLERVFMAENMSELVVRDNRDKNPEQGKGKGVIHPPLAR